MPSSAHPPILSPSYPLIHCSRQPLVRSSASPLRRLGDHIFMRRSGTLGDHLPASTPPAITWCQQSWPSVSADKSFPGGAVCKQCQQPSPRATAHNHQPIPALVSHAGSANKLCHESVWCTNLGTWNLDCFDCHAF
eukprot:11548501-Alexandrium_andersonii.AAC.1